MLDDNPIKKFTLLKPDVCRSVGRPKMRWTNGIEDDLGMLSVRGWRRNVLDRRGWKSVSEAPGAQTGLYRH
jgi:hypothetical protein